MSYELIDFSQHMRLYNGKPDLMSFKDPGRPNCPRATPWKWKIFSNMKSSPAEEDQKTWIKALARNTNLEGFFTCKDQLSLGILRPDSQSHPDWVPECLQESERWCWLRQESCRVVQLQEGFSRPEPPQINFGSLIHKAFWGASFSSSPSPESQGSTGCSPSSQSPHKPAACRGPRTPINVDAHKIH